jgi:hypothetical protein
MGKVNLKTRQIIEAQDMIIRGSTWHEVYDRTGITREMFQEMMELLSQ